jgi:predicted ribosome quality control (RQC) complex YloA/Tae2 family protein
MPWDEIQKWLNSAASQGNPLAKTFVRLNLPDNSIVLRLSDPYEHLDNSESSEDNDSDQETTKNKKSKQKKTKKGMDIELDLNLTAAQNARDHFTDRKAAAVKQQKTVQSSEIALKNAQKQAQNRVKQVR